jgi:hypothetical protein
LTEAPTIVLAPTLKASLEPTELLYWTVPFWTPSVPTSSPGATIPGLRSGTDDVVLLPVSASTGAMPNAMLLVAIQAKKRVLKFMTALMRKVVF